MGGRFPSHLPATSWVLALKLSLSQTELTLLPQVAFWGSSPSVNAPSPGFPFT